MSNNHEWVSTTALAPAVFVVVMAVAIAMWKQRPHPSKLSSQPDLAEEHDITRLREMLAVLIRARGHGAPAVTAGPASATAHQKQQPRPRQLIGYRKPVGSAGGGRLAQSALMHTAHGIRVAAEGHITLRHATKMAAHHHLAAARAVRLATAKAAFSEKLWAQRAAFALQLEINRKEVAVAAARIARVQEDIRDMYEAVKARRDCAVANCIRLQVVCAVVYTAMLLHAQVPYVKCAAVPKFSWWSFVKYARAALCHAMLDAQTTVYAMVPTIISLLFVFSPMRAIMLGAAVLSTISPAVLHAIGMRFMWALVPVMCLVVLRRVLLEDAQRRYTVLRGDDDTLHSRVVLAFEPAVWKIPQSVWLGVILPIISTAAMAATLHVAVPLG